MEEFDDILLLLNDLFFIPNVCNQIIINYLVIITIKFDSKLRVGRVYDMTATHDKIIIKTDNGMQIVYFDKERDKCIYMRHGGILVNSMTIDATYENGIIYKTSLNQKIYTHITQLFPNDYKIHMNDNSLFTYSSKYICKYSIPNVHDHIYEYWPKYSVGEYMLMDNDDVYVLQGNYIIKFNYYISDEQKLLVNPSIDQVIKNIYVYENELYVLKKIKQNIYIIVYCKNTFELIYKTLLPKLRIANECHFVVNKYYVVINQYHKLSSYKPDNCTKLYFYEKIDNRLSIA